MGGSHQSMITSWVVKLQDFKSLGLIRNGIESWRIDL